MKYSQMYLLLMNLSFISSVASGKWFLGIFGIYYAVMATWNYLSEQNL